MAPEIEHNNWSIVLVGSINPAIFHPAWFEMHGVISKEIAESSEVRVVHADVASMSMGNIRIDVQRNRFHVQTEVAPEVTILDMVLRVFGDLLPHTHINQFGINKDSHFRTENMEKRVTLGRMFAPTAPWGAFGKRIEESKGNLTGGMTNVTMREIVDGEGWSGYIDARLKPSPDLDQLTGVHVAVNNHFELKSYQDGEGAMRALDLLKNNFEDRMAKAEEIIESVVDNSK